MNHGYCKNCWWWECFKSINIPQVKGICFMQSRNIDVPDAAFLKETSSNDYCLDYTNRKKEEKKFGTLEDWILKK